MNCSTWTSSLVSISEIVSWILFVVPRRDMFIPLTVGGGLRTLEDIRHVLTAGAEKMSLNTAAVSRPEIIREAALRFGSSTIVVSIEAITESGWELRSVHR